MILGNQGRKDITCLHYHKIDWVDIQVRRDLSIRATSGWGARGRVLNFRDMSLPGEMELHRPRKLEMEVER